MKPIRLAASAALTAIVAACVPQPRPVPPVQVEPVPAPTAAPVPPAPVHDDWMDAPATPGDWSYAARTSGGGTASFGRYGVGSPGTELEFAL